LGMGCTKRM